MKNLLRVQDAKTWFLDLKMFQEVYGEKQLESVSCIQFIFKVLQISKSSVEVQLNYTW